MYLSRVVVSARLDWRYKIKLLSKHVISCPLCVTELSVLSDDINVSAILVVQGVKLNWSLAPIRSER